MVGERKRTEKRKILNCGKRGIIRDDQSERNVLERGCWCENKPRVEMAVEQEWKDQTCRGIVSLGSLSEFSMMSMFFVLTVLLRNLNVVLF